MAKLQQLRSKGDIQNDGYGSNIRYVGVLYLLHHMHHFLGGEPSKKLKKKKVVR